MNLREPRLLKWWMEQASLFHESESGVNESARATLAEVVDGAGVPVFQTNLVG